MAAISTFRRMVIGGIAFGICLTVLASMAYWQFHRASEREKAKNELATELRLLTANLQTGIDENDFLRQVARVRAAYAGSQSYLTTEQNTKFYIIDLSLEDAKLGWDLVNLVKDRTELQKRKVELQQNMSDIDQRISTFLATIR
jgi:hypothetical protein